MTLNEFKQAFGRARKLRKKVHLRKKKEKRDSDASLSAFYLISYSLHIDPKSNRSIRKKNLIETSMKPSFWCKNGRRNVHKMMEL